MNCRRWLNTVFSFFCLIVYVGAEGASAAESDIDRLSAYSYEELLEKAEKGDGKAQYRVAELYFEGRAGAPQNNNEAVRWFTHAAQQNHAEAQFALGLIYYTGDIVERDFVTAAKWYKKAAAQGNDMAQYNLGAMYHQGRGVPRDYETALQWIIRSARQGNAEVQRTLGMLYFTGQGVSKNYPEAARWFRRSAEQGHAQAQYDLAVMYFNGMGVEKDHVEAYKWFNLSAGQGINSAAELRERLEKKMSLDEVSEAQSRSRGFLKK